MIGSVFKLGIVELAFSIYIYFTFFKRADYKITYFSLCFILFYLITFINTAIFIFLNDIPNTVLYDIFINLRYYFIQISFALAVYVYLKSKPIAYTLDIILIGVVANCFVGVLELLIGSKRIHMFFPWAGSVDYERIHMFFPEPSSAGYYYLFVFFIITHYFFKSWHFYITRLFLFVGLAIGSKAQFILLFIVGLLKYSSPVKLFLFIGTIFTVLYTYKNEITSIPVIKYNMYVLETYLDSGLKNFKESNRIWGTYVSRISGIEGAIRCLYENPFGIGSGYRVWFSNNMTDTGIDNTETNEIIASYSATARSNLLDLFLRTGIIGLIIYCYIGSGFYHIRKSHYFLYQSFIMLTLASLFIELNPMFTYIAILRVLLEKETRISYEKD